VFPCKLTAGGATYDLWLIPTAEKPLGT
jgi:hypothetical protein